MQFNKQLSFNSFNDAWETYKTHFNTNAELERFLHATMAAQSATCKISEIIALKPLNLDLLRLNAQTPAEAYPVDNRPRGASDLKSVKYHQKNICSPIVMIMDNINDSNGHPRCIFADGVHRLVAAKLLGKRSVVCCIIRY